MHASRALCNLISAVRWMTARPTKYTFNVVKWFSHTIHVHVSVHTDCLRVFHACQCHILWYFQNCAARSCRSTWPPSRTSWACRRPSVSGIPPDLPPTEASRTSSDVVLPRSSTVAFRCWPPWDTSPQWLDWTAALHLESFSQVCCVKASMSATALYSRGIYCQTVVACTWWNNPQEITGKFPGYLSPSAGLKFADVPNGLAAISKVPAAGHGWSNWFHLNP